MLLLSRYGQSKRTHVYRLVTDNSLEKKIYDRQVNKQGMADRIVDEMNPDAHLSTRDVHSLICDEEEDTGTGEEVRASAVTFSDPVMRSVVTRHGDKLTRPPFAPVNLGEGDPAAYAGHPVAVGHLLPNVVAHVEDLKEAGEGGPPRL